MATLDLGSITVDDSIVVKVQDAFGQPSLAKLRDTARLLVRRYLREEAIERYLALIKAEGDADTDTRLGVEKGQLETGWPSV